LHARARAHVMIQQTEKRNKFGGMNYVLEKDDNFNRINFDFNPDGGGCTG